ncbi:MAG TPA: hypothetical protein VJR89_30655 [Polyangiales bacterium]|nr:hypothetical protein [Polyangiales bacterium]
MARRPKHPDEERETTSGSSTTTSLGALLQAAHVSAAPARSTGRPSRGTHVQPRAPRGDAEARTRELAARKRVAALLSGGVHFKIKREAGQVLGQRGTSSTKLAAGLAHRRFTPEVTLDLRGQPETDAREAIEGFIRVHHRRGVRQLSIVWDPRPDEAGVDSALEAVLAGLTNSAVAPLVRAFASAHVSLGGNAALGVLLI